MLYDRGCEEIEELAAYLIEDRGIISVGRAAGEGPEVPLPVREYRVSDGECVIVNAEVSRHDCPMWDDLLAAHEAALTDFPGACAFLLYDADYVKGLLYQAIRESLINQVRLRETP